MRVGGEEPIEVDVRVIAATNQDLRHLVELGEFRRDLYYRLNVLRIELPPLRERREDIPLLIDAFIRQVTREHDLEPVRLSPDALTILMEYDWPGNVRELRNLVESMVVLAPGRTIRPEDIPPEVRMGTGPRRQLPVPVPRQSRREGEGPSPELEFIFRTLLQLRIDVEDLRKEFEEFRRSHPELPAGAPSYPYPYPSYPYVPSGLVAGPTGIEVASVSQPNAAEDDGDDAEDEGVVVYRPGMTMNDLEREAITAALREVGGNRRKAAELLGIGERTLYRKLKEYAIPV